MLNVYLRDGLEYDVRRVDVVVPGEGEHEMKDGSIEDRVDGPLNYCLPLMDVTRVRVSGQRKIFS